MAELQSAVDCVESCLMVTIASLGLPSLTRASGIVSKESLTLSPSSSSVSVSAVKTKLFWVSPLSKVTFCGAGVVGRGGAALVGLLNGNAHIALGIRAQ